MIVVWLVMPGSVDVIDVEGGTHQRRGAQMPR